MMIGERTHHLNATIQVPPWPVYNDPPTPTNYSPYPICGVNSPRNTVGGGGEFSTCDAALTALRRFLPSNDAYNFSDDGGDDTAIDAYSCDEFRMYEFKVRRCARGRSHDWTECPYAHPGEKARRRDPRKYHYSGTACPDFRKGNCKKGDSCEFAHGVFECWLHPTRYRTQPCKDGVNCRRRVCFFAHTPEQLRILPQQQQSPRSGCGSTGLSDSYDGSPLRQHHHHQLSGLDPYLISNSFLSSSPTSTLMSPPRSPPSDSPPLSPTGIVTPVRKCNGSSMNELLVSLRQLQLTKATKSPIGTGGCGSWGIQQIASPRGNLSYASGLTSTIPATPTRVGAIGGSSGIGLLDGWDEPVERVESGRNLRVMLAEKLNNESSFDTDDVVGSCGSVPDVDWVSDLLQ